MFLRKSIILIPLIVLRRLSSQTAVFCPSTSCRGPPITPKVYGILSYVRHLDRSPIAVYFLPETVGRVTSHDIHLANKYHTADCHGGGDDWKVHAHKFEPLDPNMFSS